ncbi:MAG: hypothetical protein QXS93_00150 [Candidatus Micrarchaeia archaeon]
MEIRNLGILDIDLIIAFILVLFMLVVCTDVASVITSSANNNLKASNQIASVIARSYGVLSQLSEGRDNEITLAKLQTLKPQNVSLRTTSGYYYGGPQSLICVKRGVYVKDIKEVGILEVC